MTRIAQPFLSLVLALAPAAVLAQEGAPVSSITDASWPDYRGMYTESPLCSKDEITLWTCKTHTQVFSLCSSQVVTRTSGYMQYRASRRGKVVFTYPAVKKPPLGSFAYESSPNGDASVGFASHGYNYLLEDPLRGGSSIFVSEPDGSGSETEIECAGNQTLQVNYTMRLMYDSGIWERN
jgi:hypothetical protein